MRRVKVQEKEREAAFVAAETTVFVSQQHGGTRATNVTQTKTRGTSVHRCVHAAMEQESDSGALQEEGYKHSGTACTQTCTMEAEGLWLVPFTVNTDGRMGK